MLELPSYLPADIKVTPEYLAKTPEPVLRLLAYLIEALDKSRNRNDELEAKMGRNSSNSDKPPSTDSPLVPVKAKGKTKGRPGAKVGHVGHRQAMLPPTKTLELHPAHCRCGCAHIQGLEPYYTHQTIELPEIQMDVTHFVLFRGKCPECGRTNKALVPEEHRTGFGPRFSAMIAELTGSHRDSRRIVQNYCDSVLGLHISLGAVQKILDRVSAAIEPHYDAIADKARTSKVNNIDETSWRRNGLLAWLWVMGSATVAFFMIHSNRSRKAFEALIEDWKGILVSDGYGVYIKWAGMRQCCLAHLIRKAKGLAERKDPGVARCGKWARDELLRLCKMATAPPSVGEWNMFYARFLRLIALYGGREDDAGKLVRRLQSEMENLWLFLRQEGVPATNNHAERLLRFAVLWRKSSLGTASEKGDRWVERILSLGQTCRMRRMRTFPVLVDAIKCSFQGKAPDVTWI